MFWSGAAEHGSLEEMVIKLVLEEQSATDIGVLGRKTPEVHGQPRHSLLPNARVTTRQGPSDIRPEKSVDMNHVWINDQK